MRRRGSNEIAESKPNSSRTRGAPTLRFARDVALKICRCPFSTNAERLTRFEQEARAAAALNHPNFIAVYDVGQHNGAPYIVSELLEGETLREQLHGGALPVRRAVEYAIQLARGLAAAHDKGIVHRDLKPENIFITAEGQAKILDFGLSDDCDIRRARWPARRPSGLHRSENATLPGQAV